ncbi:MAG: 13E12 repeat family protein [Microlunatus sp.]|nr:13E12 repeat family protein [Microlunatus sp.]MDN5770877.1 13E12 repeat family protein [Microlunatus sp.]
MIDKVARRVVEPATLTAIDDGVVVAAQTRTPKQLAGWLWRLVVRWEPAAFQQRHRRALAERRVTITQGSDGMGYVTGEVSAAIDAQLAWMATTLGADDPRSYQQRRADMFADLLLGRLGLDHTDQLDGQEDSGDPRDTDAPQDAGASEDLGAAARDSEEAPAARGRTG